MQPGTTWAQPEKAEGVDGPALITTDGVASYREGDELQPSSCGCSSCLSGDGCAIEVVPYERGLRSEDPRVALGAEALGLLAAALPIDGGGCYVLDGRGRPVRTVAFEPQPWPWPAVDAFRAYSSELRQLDPFSRADGSGHIATVLTTDDLGHADFSQHAFSRRFLSRLGFTHLAMVNLLGNGRLAAQLWVARRRGRNGFSASEVRLLRRVQSLVSLTLQHALTSGEAMAHVDEQLVERLTDRELEIARLAATGATNREIARMLTISHATVGTHLHHVLAKVGVRSRTELARLTVLTTPDQRGDLRPVRPVGR